MIFLSYNGQDRQIATDICDALKNNGLEVFQDIGGIAHGEHWIKTLEKHLMQADAYVLIYGPGGVSGWVIAEMELALRRHFEGFKGDRPGLPIFSLLLPGVKSQDLPPFLSTLQAVSVKTPLSETDFAQVARNIRDAIKSRSSSDQKIEPNTSVCPFPGLATFQTEHSRFFYGRQREVVHALTWLGSTAKNGHIRWLAIDAGSGSGKSSLVRAGIIPAIERGWFGDSRVGVKPCIAIMQPGTNPLRALAKRLAAALYPVVDDSNGEHAGTTK